MRYAGRDRKPLDWSTGRPAGPRWVEFCGRLRAQWFRAGRTCYYCQSYFNGAHLIEVCHLISPLVRPDLAWDAADNLVPGHGSAKRTGNRRSPEHDLDCNWLAHNSPRYRAEPKGPGGEDRPFSAEFLAWAKAERAAHLRKGARNPVTVRETPRDSGGTRPVTVPFRSDPGSAGRPWLSNVRSNRGI